MPNPVAVSFEFFPPNDEAMADQLWAAVQRLAPLRPNFVSVTYGADGSTRARTHDCVLRIRRETSLVVAPHLTCVGAARSEILGIAEDYWREGIRHLVALRGDAPAAAAPAAVAPGALGPGAAAPDGAARGVHKPGAAAPAAAAPGPQAANGGGGTPGGTPGGGAYRPHPEGFPYAADLVRGLKSVADFDISVAAYPEGHPETGGVAADLENLKRKVDAGATRAITQFFFDTDLYLHYRDRCAANGINVKIVPGILPITRFGQLLRFAGRCGASVPDWLHRRFDGLDQDAETRRIIAANVAIEQVQRLRQHGVDEFHFYTLNRAELTYAICHALGVRGCAAEARVA
jgi:methylenetetrahydrofolate reductase (NADPH)